MLETLLKLFNILFRYFLLVFVEFHQKLSKIFLELDEILRYIYLPFMTNLLLSHCQLKHTSQILIRC